MKKLALIIVIVGLGAGLAYFAMNMEKKKTSTIAEEGLTNFAIKDTASIDKIILTNTLGSKYTVVRNSEGVWKNDQGDCVQEELVKNLLDAIYRIEVKAIVPKNQSETVMSNLNQSHVKTEIFVNGMLEKTYFVGSPTQDHYGTFMLLELPDKGRSPVPVITYIPGFRGNLQPRFNSDWKQWACSGVFKYKPENIKKITFTNYGFPETNFEIEFDGKNTFKLTSNGKPVTPVDTVRIRDYVLRYQKIHFNSHNYIHDQKGVDSIRNAPKYFKIQVEAFDGDDRGIVCHKMKAAKGVYDLDGNQLEYDQNVMWAFLDNGQMVKVQYYVFDKLMKTVSYFQGK